MNDVRNITLSAVNAIYCGNIDLFWIFGFNDYICGIIIKKRL